MYHLGALYAEVMETDPGTQTLKERKGSEENVKVRKMTEKTGKRGKN